MHQVGQSAKEGWQSYQTWKNAKQQENVMRSTVNANDAEAAYKNTLSVNTLLEQDNIPIKGRHMLADIALKNLTGNNQSAQAKYYKEKELNEYLGAPYGAMGSGQAARTGYNLINSAKKASKPTQSYGKEYRYDQINP
jgi:hypothetical protein